MLSVDVADASLVPWRQIMAPHPDVASRRFVNAESAADLYVVAHGRASEEYRDPEAFFARTYLTTGLRTLLETAASRLSGRPVDPVVELQTSFGGGKPVRSSRFTTLRQASPRKLKGRTNTARVDRN